MEGSGDNNEIYKVLFFGSWAIESQNELFLACIIVTVIALVFQGKTISRKFSIKIKVYYVQREKLKLGTNQFLI